MSYTKNYYAVLGLQTPGLATGNTLIDLDLRKAYKLALLAAHPDKQPSQTPLSATTARTSTKHTAYSVDDVKEAYNILSDPSQRKAYNDFLLRNPALSNSEIGGVKDSDFVLGLEMLDLSDFEEGSGGMEWTRTCRCGDEKGFRISEEELEGAEGRGEKEVLVGCEGCSLWVRVGFEVEEG